MSFVYNGIIINDRLDVSNNGHIITTTKAQLITDDGTKSVALDIPTINNQVLISDDTQNTGLKWTKLTPHDLGLIAGDGIIFVGNQINVGSSNTIFAETDNISVRSSEIANQSLLSTGFENSEAVYGAVPLNDSNAVTSILPIKNGGTGTSTFETASSLISTNDDNTALISTGINLNDIIIKHYIVQTTSDKFTTIHSIPTLKNTIYEINATFIARKPTPPHETAKFKINALFNNIEGVLSLVDNALDIVFIPVSTTWKALIAANSTNIDFIVSGSASTDVNWKVSIHPPVSLQ